MEAVAERRAAVEARPQPRSPEPQRLPPSARRLPEGPAHPDLRLRRPQPAVVEPGPQPAVASPPLNERSLGEEIHPLCYGISFAAALWIVGVYALVFLAAPHALMMLTISFAFLVMYAGTPLVMWRSRRTESRASARGFAAFARAELETWAGPLHGREAAIQVVTIPLALALAATGIAFAVAAAQ